MASVTRGLPASQGSDDRPAPDDPSIVLVEGEALKALPVRAAANNDIPGQMVEAPNPALPVRRQTTRLRRHLVAGDVLALIAVWLPLALVQTHGAIATRLASAGVAVVVTLLAMQHAGLYKARVCAVRSLEAVRVSVASLIGACAFFGCEWLAGSATAARAIAGAIGSAVAILILRWRFGRWLKMKRSTGQFLRTVVLIGTNDDAASVWSLINEEPELGYKVAAVIGDQRFQAPWMDVPSSADVRELGDLAKMVGAGGVIIVGNALGAEATSEAVSQSLTVGLHVQVWPGLAGLSTRRLRMAPVLGVPVFYIEPRAKTPWEEAAKRLMDVALTLAILPIVLPVLLLAALLIKLEDRGPVIYRHRVVGRGGAPITVLKLRTMVPNAAQMLNNVSALNERTGGPLFKASYDPRVTKIGRLLRATSIDELPQLWNVITGTMSLVGPRFALPHEVEHFDEDLRRRDEMRPGMTGLWQSEARDNPSFSAYRRLDLFYVDNWSLSLDVAILANTFHGVAVRAIRVFSPVKRSRNSDRQVAEPVIQER